MGSYETQRHIRTEEGVFLNLNKIPAIKTRTETNSPVMRFMGKSVIGARQEQDCASIYTFITQPIALQSIRKSIMSDILPRLFSKWGQRNTKGLKIILSSYRKLEEAKIWLDGREFDSRQDKIFVSSLERPDRPWGPPCLLFNLYRGFYPTSKAVEFPHPYRTALGPTLPPI